MRLFSGFVGLDDAEYARFAFRVAHRLPMATDYTGPGVFPSRLGVILPTAILFHWLGVGEWTLVGYPFVLSLLGIVCAYVCASRLFGSPAGLLAAVLMAMFPWDIDGATKLLPEMPAAFYAAIGLTALALVDFARERRRVALFCAGAVTGLALGVSWLCNESVAYLAPFFLIWLLITLRQRGASMLFLWAGIAAGSLAVLGGEMIAYRLTTGDFLFRFHQVERNYHEWGKSFLTERSSFGWTKDESYAHAVLERLFVSGPKEIFLNRSFLFAPLIALSATLYGWRRRDRAFLLPSLWLWTFVLMFNFSSSSHSYLPLALHDRDLSLIFFPAILLIVGFAARVAPFVRPADIRTPGRFARWAGALAFAVMALLGLQQLEWRLRTPIDWLAEIRALRAHVTPATPLYADALSLRAFEFFSSYPQRPVWRDLGAIAPADVPANSFVLIYPPGIAWLERETGTWVAWPTPGPTDPAGYWKDRFAHGPPSSWAMVWRNGDVKLYHVNAGPTVASTSEPR